MLKTYSPHATAYAVRCKPNALRDWRRHGYLMGALGERRGKGQMFSLSDVARIAVAAFIARAGVKLQNAFDIAAEQGSTIDKIAAGVRLTVKTSDVFLTFVIDPDLSSPASITGAPISNITFDDEPIGLVQVNLSSLLRSVVGRLESFEENVRAAA